MNASVAQPLIARSVQLPRGAAGRTLPQMLRDNARDFGNRTALRSKRAGLWQGLGWAELDRQTRRVAEALAAQGLGPGDVLAIISENRAESWIAQVAANCLGAVAVSIYPDAAAAEIAYILDHSRARLALAEDQEQVDKILQLRGDLAQLATVLYIDPRGRWTYDAPGLVALDTALETAAPLPDLAARIDAGRPGDIAVLSYTSGTTGRPKAARLSHDFMLDNAYRLMGALDIRAGGNYLSYISPAWAAEQFFGVALPMLAPLVLNFAEKPETVQRDLREIGPEFLMFTPRQWEMQASDADARMLDAPAWRQRLYDWGLRQGADRAANCGGLWSRLVTWPLADQLVLKGIRDFLGLTRARAVLSGGAGMSGQIFDRFRAIGVPLGNLYGCSELGLIATHWPGERDSGSMGSLMPSDPSIAPPMRAWVDENGQLRLRVKAFSGYLDNPEATADMGTSDEGFHTGDAVRLDPSGALAFLDRVKDLRRLANGQPYPPQFLENHLRADPLIREAMVIGDQRHDRVVALINIDMEIAGRLAERNGLAFGTFTELSQLEPVRRAVLAAVERVNARVDPWAQITAFCNLPKDLDPDDGELTRSRKLRRDAIEARYHALVAGLYDGSDAVHCDIQITYQDGHASRLQAHVPMNRLATTAERKPT